MKKKFAYIAVGLILTTSLFTGCTLTKSKQDIAVNKIVDDDDNDNDKKEKKKREKDKKIEYHVISESAFWDILEDHDYSSENDKTETFQEQMDETGLETEVTYYYDGDVEFALINLDDAEVADQLFESCKESHSENYPSSNESSEGNAEIWEGTNKEEKTFCKMYKVDNQILMVGGPKKEKKNINKTVVDLYASKAEVSDDTSDKKKKRLVDEKDDENETELEEITKSLDESSNEDNDSKQGIEENSSDLASKIVGQWEAAAAVNKETDEEVELTDVWGSSYLSYGSSFTLKENGEFIDAIQPITTGDACTTGTYQLEEDGTDAANLYLNYDDGTSKTLYVIELEDGVYTIGSDEFDEANYVYYVLN